MSGIEPALSTCKGALALVKAKKNPMALARTMSDGGADDAMRAMTVLVKIVAGDDDHERCGQGPLLMARSVLGDELDVPVDVVEDEPAWWRRADGAPATAREGVPWGAAQSVLGTGADDDLPG